VSSARQPAASTVFSVVQSAVVGAVINALLNGGIGWAVAPASGMPLWGAVSVGGDLIATAFGIAFGTALVVTPLQRAVARQGAMTLPPLPDFLRLGFPRWPSSVLRRSLNLGVLGVLLFAPLPLVGLWLVAPTGLSAPAFVAFKAAFASVEGAVVTPIIAMAGLADVLRRDA